MMNLILESTDSTIVSATIFGLHEAAHLDLKCCRGTIGSDHLDQGLSDDVDHSGLDAII